MQAFFADFNWNVFFLTLVVLGVIAWRFKAIVGVLGLGANNKDAIGLVTALRQKTCCKSPAVREAIAKSCDDIEAQLNKPDKPEPKSA